MKKLLSILLLYTVLLCVGCVPVDEPQAKEQAVIDAQNVAYESENQDVLPSEVLEESNTIEKDNPLEGFPLNTDSPYGGSGYIPDPEPVEPTVEEASE